MANLLNFVKVTPLVLGVSVLVAQGAVANPTESPVSPTPQTQVDPSSQQLLQQMQQMREGKSFNAQVYNQPMSQVTSVNQLRDVEPTAWAYEALRSLVERYGCIVGYPDRTFRGDRALTRWEFAAGLNACLNVIERLLQENVAVLKEDIDKLKRLAQEFEAELAALGARVDNLEARVSFLEDHQFSTTTKLKGEVVFSIADSFGNRAGGDSDISQTAFNDRVRLNFETSFTGKDLLRTRLQAGNFNNTFNQRGVTGTNMTRLAFDDGVSNDVVLDDLWYRTPIGDNVTLWAGANALNLDDVFYTFNPYLESGGTGSLSRLERYNNLAYRGPSGAGLAVKYKFGDQFNITATYLADSGSAGNPLPAQGLFNGSYSTGAQLVFSPMKTLDLGFTYLHTYQNSYTTYNNNRVGVALFGNVSSPDAERPFGNVPTSSDRYNLQLSWKAADWLNFTAWGGYAQATAQTAIGGGQDIWTWNAAFNFLDLGKEGAVFSLSGGMPPRGGENSDTVNRTNGTSYIVQAQYAFPVTDNIQLTPGLYVVFNPNNNDNNDTEWMGVIRSTFKF